MASLAPDRPAATPATGPDEAKIRRDLAAAYRLVALFGWDDLVATHLSARLPGEGHVFLINPFGMLFEEVTASSLVKINAAGELLEPTPWQVNKAGFVAHSAVHLAREDAGCVIHLHTRDGVAVSALEEGLLPLNQNALLVSGDVAMHGYEGVFEDLDERERLARDLGSHNAMILRNHGTLTLGRTVAEAFTRTYYLEWACTTQVRTLAMGRPIQLPPEAVITEMEKGMSPESMERYCDHVVWPAMLRKLDRIDPSWKD
jgi:ribulose-5-phosphate 4-epimerase/fuculose-1-phosphate aldolase